MSNFVIERQEGTEWVPKARCNFEDKKQFIAISKNPGYRIREDGVDVTSRYQTVSKTSNKASSANANSSSAMKPSQYKSLNKQEKGLIQHKVKLLLELKKKRSEILLELNVSESTYDLIRADMKSSSITDSSKTKSHVATKSKSTTTKKYRGTLLKGY